MGKTLGGYGTISGRYPGEWGMGVGEDCDLLSVALERILCGERSEYIAVLLRMKQRFIRDFLRDSPTCSHFESLIRVLTMLLWDSL